MYIYGLIWSGIPHTLCRECALEMLREQGKYRRDKSDNQNLLNYANKRQAMYEDTLDEADNITCVYDTDDLSAYVCDSCLSSLDPDIEKFH